MFKCHFICLLTWINPEVNSCICILDLYYNFHLFLYFFHYVNCLISNNDSILKFKPNVVCYFTGEESDLIKSLKSRKFTISGWNSTGVGVPQSTVKISTSILYIWNPCTYILWVFLLTIGINNCFVLEDHP